MKQTKIEWTHHTFNPWWGCAKISPACMHCYAEMTAKRYGKCSWGKNASRRFFSDTHWKEPLKWNDEAQRRGERERVFCASMADVFEDRLDLIVHRERLWKVIQTTPWLNWLLLTKRPENVSSMIPWNSDAWPSNVWLGTTVESQQYAEKRLPHLLSHKAAVRFLSCEPLLGEVDLRPWFTPSGLEPLNWVIAGGESGGKSRATNPAWIQKLQNDCQQAKIPFHFKQWGNWAPPDGEKDNKRIQSVIFDHKRILLVRKSKKATGRKLDGKIYNEFPVLS